MSLDTTKAAPEDVEAPENLGSHLRGVLRQQAAWIFLLLIAIVIVFSVLAGDRFLSWDNFSTVAQNASIWAVLSVGITFVIITAGIDLAIGSILVFASVTSAMTMQAMGGEGWWVAIVGIVVAVISGTAWGVVHGFVVAKMRIPPLITTLGTLSIALGAAQLLTDGVDISATPAVLADSVGYGRVVGIPVLSIIAAIVMVLGGILLHRTRFGLYTYAVGSSQESARRVGIDVDAHLFKVYILCSFLSGLAGILLLAQYGTTTIGGQTLTNLNVITAVVIGGSSIFGGQGSMFGSAVGLFIPAVLLSGFTILGVQQYWQAVAVGIVLILAVYIDQANRAAGSRGSRTTTRLGALREFFSPTT